MPDVPPSVNDGGEGGSYYDPAECVHVGGNATCTEKAVCSLCGEKYGEPRGHNVYVMKAVAPTCTEEGLSEGEKCLRCETVLKAQETVPATGHTLVNVEGSPATCTVDGYSAHKKCENCNFTEGKMTLSASHSYTSYAALEPTCTTDGYTAYSKCSKCGNTTGYAVLPAGHSFSDPDANGTRTCSGCGLVEVSTSEGLQAVLDSVHSNVIIQLVKNVAYNMVYMGRPTKDNNTEMFCETHSYTTTDEVEFVQHLADGNYHTTPKYTTTLDGVTIVGAEGATIAGLVASSGHVYGDVYDYVRDKDYDSGSAYYLTLKMSNITFKNVSFTGKVDINTSKEDSVYDGFNFIGCFFTTGGIDSSNSCALRYYNESNNGNVRNLKVEGCSFNNCYQGMYVSNVGSVTVIDSHFDTTGHNAIALQSAGDKAVTMNVLISGNTFENIADRIIRFGKVGEDSDIVIKNNTANNSGDTDGELSKSESLCTVTLEGNIWNGSTDEEAMDKFININVYLLVDGEHVHSWTTDVVTGNKTCTACGTVEIESSAGLKDALANIQDGDTVILPTGTYELPASISGKNVVLEGAGEDTVFDFTKPYNVGDASITFRNLKIQSKNENVMNNLGIQHTTGDIVYENCTFDGAVVSEHRGTVTYIGCTFTGTGYITTYAVDAATFIDCTFDKADSRAVLVYSHGDTPCVVTLTDCEFYADAIGKTGAGDWTAAVEVDTTNISSPGTSVTVTNCTIDDMYSGIVRDKSSAGKANAVITVDGQVWAFQTTQLMNALEADNEIIDIVLLKDISVNISTGKQLGGANTQSITITGINDSIVCTLDNTYRSYFNLANPDGKLYLNDMTLVNTHTGTHFFDYTTHFNCDVVAENVNFAKAPLINSGVTAVFTDCDFNQNSTDGYGLWIMSGANVTVSGGVLNSERGFKIADENSAAAETILNVSGTKFNNIKKAAILVTTKHGATVTVNNLDISNCQADNTNPVWIDEDRVEYANTITVIGGSVINEP